jgi:hypothetical protein
MEKLNVFVNRLKRIGIDITLVGNVPWIYLNSVNGKLVTEKFLGNHGFTVAFLPADPAKELYFTNIRLIFYIIRKYRK